MTEYELGTLFWAKFSALGTCIGTFATFCAICVALWQTKYSSRKKLKLSLSDLMLLTDGQTYLALTVCNIGNRNVQIDSWIIKGNKSNGIIYPNVVYTDSVCTLPVELKCEKSVILMWKKEDFLRAIADLGRKKVITPYKRIEYQIIDSTGKVYKIKSKYRASYYNQSPNHQKTAR